MCVTANVTSSRRHVLGHKVDLVRNDNNMGCDPPAEYALKNNMDVLENPGVVGCRKRAGRPPDLTLDP